MNTLLPKSSQKTVAPVRISLLEHGPLPAATNKDCIRMLWLRKGTASYTIDQTEFLIRRDTLISINGRQLDMELHENAVGYEIAFDPYLICLTRNETLPGKDQDFLGLLTSGTSIAIDTETSAHLEELLEKLSTQDGHDGYKPMLLACYLRIFLVYLARQYEVCSPVAGCQNILVKRFMALLEKNFRHNKAVASYAAELFVTPGYLNEVVKRQSGYPAGHHIRQRVIAEAKRNAVDTSANMKEIAFTLGFEDMAHFSKFFKKATGSSFSEYRRSLQLKPAG